MLGHSIHIRALAAEDVERWHLDDALLDDLGAYVAVDGEDLGVCLAAVVRITDPLLVWSDADGQGTPIGDDERFAYAVVTIMQGVHPHLFYDVAQGV